MNTEMQVHKEKVQSTIKTPKVKNWYSVDEIGRQSLNDQVETRRDRTFDTEAQKTLLKQTGSKHTVKACNKSTTSHHR